MTTAESRARYKLGAAMLTTYGYALVGGAAVKPFLDTGEVTLVSAGSLILGLACHGLSMYIAPKGEAS
jgi:hypothetical protein